MGRPQAPDEGLPEVVQNRPTPVPNPHGDHLPEVVPDSSPEAAQGQRYFMETDKYPAQYDTAPKLLHEEPTTPGTSPGQQYQQPWGPGSVGGDHSVSALSPNSSVPWHSFPPGADDQQTYVGSEPETEKRICGLRKRLFIIIAVIVGIVVVVAAVGGGVGGAMAARQTDEAAPAETSSAAESTSSAASTTASGETGTSTTSSAPSPSITNLNDQVDPRIFEKFAFQGWAKNNYTGNATEVLLEPGFYDLDINVVSYYWVTNKTDCCVTFCKDHEETGGFKCDSVRQNATQDQTGFSRVSLWCGNRLNEEWQVKCSE
ncbi:uncharacterized protein B0H64DRAFT_42703 [Chaetomium fimeti]|uniref:Uncharacterized protein n=1 Tax=Chaetomium fimeti TaxID=1854472 RepID=A0AAE0H765_9PEZI|nr:hypothetical protein B0H64DRAFT_42703 [Chaetomium fimeti]